MFVRNSDLASLDTSSPPLVGCVSSFLRPLREEGNGAVAAAAVTTAAAASPRLFFDYVCTLQSWLLLRLSFFGRSYAPR
jgi:hypothetical protein